MKRFIKMIPIIILVIFILTVNIGAVYFAGNINTPRYVAPLQFDMEIEGATVSLTPTISYGNDWFDTVDWTEETAYEDSGETYYMFTKEEFYLDDISEGILEVYYNMRFDVPTDLDYFKMNITAPTGVYDFQIYNVPKIYIPNGFTVTGTIEYHVRFTDYQGDDRQTGYTYYQEVNQGTGMLDLMTDEYNGELITGGVVIDYYRAELLLDWQGTSGGGGGGYYTWNQTLRYPDDELLGLIQNYENDGFLEVLTDVTFLVDTNDYRYEFGSFALMFDENLHDLGYGYESSGEVVLCYDYNRNRWNIVTLDDGTISAQEIKTVYFPQGVIEMFSLSSDLTNAEIMFVNYFLNNTTYQGGTFSDINSIDNGQMYFQYTVDRELADNANIIFNDLYSFGTINGGGGYVDVGTWIATAVGGFLSFEIMPGFSFGAILSVILSIILATVFLKIFAGG